MYLVGFKLNKENVLLKNATLKSYIFHIIHDRALDDSINPPAGSADTTRPFYLAGDTLQNGYVETCYSNLAQKFYLHFIFTIYFISYILYHIF